MHAPKAVKGWLLSNKAYLSVVYVLVVSNSQSSGMKARDRVGGGGGLPGGSWRGEVPWARGGWELL